MNANFERWQELRDARAALNNTIKQLHDEVDWWSFYDEGDKVSRQRAELDDAQWDHQMTVNEIHDLERLPEVQTGIVAEQETIRHNLRQAALLRARYGVARPASIADYFDEIRRIPTTPIHDTPLFSIGLA
ncbi:MAG TPA: hypothetical protein VKA67_00105 [Verrucomicrobiae bacterium]|nr:hypothetical protein [Verrucomicrobiae bacterium]